MNNRGFCAVGIYKPKKAVNVGGIFRSAHCFGTNYIFTIDGSYRREASDTTNAAASLPLFEYKTFDEFFANRPKNCQIVGVELDSRAIPIKSFSHPPRAVYLLGSESIGLPKDILDKCDSIIQLPGKFCLNVSNCASIVMFDRVNKAK